ncbi:unnamed protein product [Prorocentrum cordatum]|uniref:Uncharacterized protein n=1 Tax=Prorocentrum cordatum TaxID=2364126 RepID=A0ABN9SJ91_9DINO|nr:unnamed protein product [Polarella glacialis]
MYRNLRPAPLNMALVPGLHLSTSKSSTYQDLRPASLDMALVPERHLSTSKGNTYQDLRPAPLDMALVPGRHLSTAKGSTYRDLRPAPLNMALVPGLHLSTAKSRPLTPCEDAKTCSSNHCGSMQHCRSLSSRRTSVDGESLVSFGVTDESRSVLLGAGHQDVGSDPGSPSSSACSGPPSPLCGAPVRRHLAGPPAARGCRPGPAAGGAAPPSPLQRARVLTRRWLAELQAASGGAAGCREPSSPVGSMLLKAKRRHARARGL